jgi:glycosyltransferase involved in cell wall biosynthesis
MNKLRVHILFEHSADLIPHGCSYIRNILPLTHPVNANAFEVTQGVEYSRADVLVVERTWKPGISLEAVEQLVDQVNRDGTCLIYSIDDNLLDLQSIPVNVRMIVRYLCRQADGILVSTEFLKKRLDQLNKKILVVPNAVDERLFTGNDERPSPHVPGEDRKIIGYMGTFTHDADLMMVLQALRAVLRQQHSSVELQFVGGFSEVDYLKYFDGLPVRVLRVPTPDVEYPRFVTWMKKNIHWHLGIAPLEAIDFNLTKSDIKFLDYSALGIPGVYSQVPSYEATVNHLRTGYLVENTPEAWVDAMEDLLLDDALRGKMATAAQEYVFSNRTLEHCAPNWREAIQSIAYIA